MYIAEICNYLHSTDLSFIIFCTGLIVVIKIEYFMKFSFQSLPKIINWVNIEFSYRSCYLVLLKTLICAPSGFVEYHKCYMFSLYKDKNSYDVNIKCFILMKALFLQLED